MQLQIDGNFRVFPSTHTNKLWFKNSLVLLLSEKEVQKELEFTNTQTKRFDEREKQLQTLFFKKRVELLRELKNTQQVEKVLSTEISEIEENILAMLLPHQKEWLLNIVRRQQLRSFGFINMLNSKSFAKQLDLNEKQLTAIRKESKAQFIKTRKWALKTEESLMKKIMELLPKSKSAKLKSILGKRPEWHWVLLDLWVVDFETSIK